MKKTHLIIITAIILSFAIGIYFYPQLPDRLASHWNAESLVDGYMTKFWGLFLMPIIALAGFLLFIALPKIDPLKENIEKFRKQYDIFIVMFILFLFYLYILTLLFNLGFYFNMIQMLAPAFGALFYYIGILMESAKRNWFIGIRTPWTLSSDKVWEKTHKLGAKLFKGAGILSLGAVILPDYAIYFIMVPIMAVAAYTIIYSYLEYKKQ
ncbi:MAG: SdpI family protein [archaeon]